MDLSTPVFTIEGLETKFDLNIASNSLAIKFGDYLEAMVFQKLHYCIQKGFGIIINGRRWIYKSIEEWIRDWFPILTPWKMNQILLSLVEKGFVLREHLFAQHHGHNFHVKNRTLYYSPNYEKFEESDINPENSANKVSSNINPENSANKVSSNINPENSANKVNSRFLNNQKTVLCPDRIGFSVYPENQSDITIKINNQIETSHPNPSHSSKKSKPRPKLKIRTSPRTQSEIPIPNTNTHSGGGDSSPNSPNSKPIHQDKGTQPKVKLSDVIARPKKLNVGHKAVEVKASSAGVDEKINKEDKCTIRQAVQEVVQSIDVPQVEVVQDVQEPVQQQFVEESTSDPVESPPEPQPTTQRQKTPRGTKPRKRVYENALWESPQQRIRFIQDCTAAVARGVGNARNNLALVTFVVHQVDLGHSHIYFEEWKAGIPIGTSERQEWEAAPSKPYPQFVEYLAEKLKDQDDSREMALNRVVNILKDKLKAGIFWRDFKRVIEGLRQDFEKAVANGLPVALPVWFIDRADVSVERAGESATVLANLAPEQMDWIYRGLPESEKLLNGTGNLSLPGAESAQETQLVKQRRRKITPPDLWLDEDEDSLSSAPKEQIATTNYITEMLKKKGLTHLKGFKEKFVIDEKED